MQEYQLVEPGLKICGGLEAVKDWSRAAQDIKEARTVIHATLKQATFDYSRSQFNTVVSACMKMLNTMEKILPVPSGNVGELPRVNEVHSFRVEAMSILLRLLSPIAPHICHALWNELGYDGDIIDAAWPEPLEAALVQDEIELVIQVNGKLRGNMTIERTLDKESLEKLALQQPCVQKYLEGTTSVRKIIVVPGKLINVVVG